MKDATGEHTYRTYFEESPVAVFVTDERGRYVDVNESACELVGYQREELLSMSIPDLARGATDSERVESLERLRDRGRVRAEEILVHADGRDVHILLDAVAVAGDRFVAYCQDITDRKQYEQRVKEQRDGLEVLNQMLRHDIRNDLQVITGYVTLARERCTDPDLLSSLETVRQHADHAVELTNVGRDLAEVMLEVEDRLRPVDLESVLERELTDIVAAYPEAQVSYNEIPSASVVADDLLGSVFRNLLKNAIQHNDSDTPMVAVRVAERDETVTVRVIDNGPGIPDERRDVIFQKGEHSGESQGMGLGLYLVETLVETYGGEVWVDDALSDSQQRLRTRRSGLRRRATANFVTAGVEAGARSDGRDGDPIKKQ
ncbi:PAS domain S-box protein [Halobellus captivus]|uniref:PAS domain S-box protein n=1 Tax=Halobellus captivus TaxID=2592614 RepID=UPI001396C537|nr:PAS domain-containing sensor histidine kinase [Halobellus captivus]